MNMHNYWDIFTHTGRISDYMKYKQLEGEIVGRVGTNADNSRGTSDTGEERRGERQIYRHPYQ